MVNLIPICLAAVLTSKSVAALAAVFVGGLYWFLVQERREHNSPERQRERLRREYWRQV